VRQRIIAPAALAAALFLAVPAAAAEPSPGAPGVGDPYYPDYGNGGYDVSHYNLRLRYQPKNDHLSGTATLLATATQDLSRFDLDFALHVTSVRVNGHRAQHATSGAHELVITPDQPIAKGAKMTVVVTYKGTPSKVTVYGFTSWNRTPDGGVAANEPEVAWWWYPSNDHPTDKATFDVSVAVPDGSQAISNGVLTSKHSRAGWTRYNWHSDKPKATYLATLAVGTFDVRTGKTDDGIPVINAYSTNLGPVADAARASVQRTGEAIDFLESKFGKYPFDSVGGYVPDTTTHYAIETQTRPYYSPADFADGANVSVVVHELAHQWYGDCVSVHGWDDIWLNEGFATYAQWMWSEAQGEAGAQELADYAYASHPADDDFWTVPPGDPGAANQFADAVYDRGAMAIQALRHRVGDKDFFRILKGWPKKHRYGDATVHQFETYAEKVSGKPLAGLFDTWLYQPSKPKTAPGHDASASPSADGKGAGGAAPEKLREPANWQQIKAAQQHHE
jgi:aminopeptidase N